jgi:hypothetical protein
MIHRARKRSVEAPLVQHSTGVDGRTVDVSQFPDLVIIHLGMRAPVSKWPTMTSVVTLRSEGARCPC